MRVSFAGTAIDFPTGLNVDAEYWDTIGQHVLDGFASKSNQKTTDINRTIDEYRAFANELFARYELLEKRVPTPGEVKDLFNDMVGRSKIELPDPSESFFKVFDTFTHSMGEKNQWTPATYTKFASIREHFKAFDSLLNFHTATDEKMQEYVKYLGKQGMRNTTIAKNLAFVRWFFRWAASKGYYNGTIHNTFRPKLKGTDGNSKEVIFLTQEEIEVLQNFQFRHRQGHLERVRDVLLFTCFTGLRYSDAAKLTRQDIKNGFLQIVTQKTVDGIRIELNKHAQAILDKYKGIEFPQDKALPVISNVKMNQYLKELGQVCELNEPQRIVYFKGNVRHEEIYPKWQLLTTHCGRRSFVVNALRLGIPAEVIIRWTGHSDYQAMKPYVKIVDELKEQEMSKFDGMFQK
ncbi:MAG: phage integrase SAM-like domain-containing protein [Culturomica sp.]|nr:phage integrase SAM-like domain-containing protein [Culturomica sp.]